jgi:hypothetical protein
MMRAIGDPNLSGWAALPTEWDVPGVDDDELEQYLESLHAALARVYPNVRWTWREDIPPHKDVTGRVDYDALYALDADELADVLGR